MTPPMMTKSQFEQIAVKEFVAKVGKEHGWSFHFDHHDDLGRFGFVIMPPRQKEVICLFLVERATPKLLREGVHLAVDYCRKQKINYN